MCQLHLVQNKVFRCLWTIKYLYLDVEKDSEAGWKKEAIVDPFFLAEELLHIDKCRFALTQFGAKIWEDHDLFAAEWNF